MSDLANPDKFIALSENSDKHSFKSTYAEEILSFLWPALSYGEL